MVYRAVAGVKGYDRTPDQLVQAVRKGEQAIANSRLKIDLPVKDYVGLGQADTGSPSTSSPTSRRPLWDPPLFRDAARCGTQPALFAARATSRDGGSGADEPAGSRGGSRARARAGQMPGNLPAGGRRGRGAGPGAGRPMAAAVNETRLQRWVVVTGLVPIEKQEDAYNEALKKSVYYDPQNDYPQYGGYSVERVEVPGPSEAADPDWTKATKFNSSEEMRKAMGRWAQAMARTLSRPSTSTSLSRFPWGRWWAGSGAKASPTPPEIPLLNPNDVRGGMGGLGGGMVPPGGGMMPPGGDMMPGGNRMPIPA